MHSLILLPLSAYGGQSGGGVSVYRRRNEGTVKEHQTDEERKMVNAHTHTHKHTQRCLQQSVQ